jgi:hypothetical protein
MEALEIRVNDKNIPAKKYRKIIVTGTVIEIYEMDKKPYQMLTAYEKSNKPDWLELWETEIRSRTLLDKLDATTSAREYLEVIQAHNGREARNITRTRNTVRRLALANFSEGAKFVTFTFAENITSVKEANAHWKLFMLRMRRKYGKVRYMAVIEFQKRGAVHYHVIWDLPYIKKGELSEIWGNGFIKINRIDHVDNVGAYIVKYMTKDLIDERLMAVKAYQCSMGLDRPLTFRDEEAEAIIQLYELDAKKIVFESSYTSEYLGKIHYKEYNLKRL